jgi:hypothetical protein
MIDDASTALEAGIDAAADPDPLRAQAISREKADVRAWNERLTSARKFDEPARAQYAKDRKYARGDSGFEVDANLVGTNIDILESFLYAKDPDLDITPGPMVQPPSTESIRDAIEDQIQESPEMMQVGAQAAALAVQRGVPPQEAMIHGQAAHAAAVEEKIRAEVDTMRKRYARRLREIKSFAETCEIVGSSLWLQASLKRRGRPWVRSGLTIGIGIIKASWQERTAPSPETSKAINDLQANLEKAQSLQAEIAEGEAGIITRAVDAVKGIAGSDVESKVADLERQLAALQGQAERVVDRRFVVDNVAGEDFQVAPGFTMANHLDAPWNAHRIYLGYEDALSQVRDHLSRYGDPDELMSRATRFTARKPEMVQCESAMLADTIDAKQADAFKEGSNADDGGGGDFVALWEIWDRESNTVMTMIDGVTCWVKEQWTPPATTRFYPFFLFTTSEVDGQRHPQSLVTRTMKLVDEYNRIGSAEAEHRRRVIPKTAFNAGLMSQEDARKLEKGGIQEMVAISPTQPNQPIADMLFPVPYAGLDAALYDRSRIIQEIERVWAIQEALSGAVNVAKTATEAEIQQSGFQARTGGRRDALESSLSELAEYTIEIARVFMTDEDVRNIAGPDAFWPPYGGPDDLYRMIQVDIRAGSSGKPNTSAEREAWATMLPMLQNGIVQIGQLRGSSPQAVADSLEYLLRLTAEKVGERIDLDQIIPQADIIQPQMPGIPGMGGPPGAAPGMPPGPEDPPGGPASADPLAPQ